VVKVKDRDTTFLSIRKEISGLRRRRLFSVLLFHLFLILTILLVFIAVLLFVDRISYLVEGQREILRFIFYFIPLVPVVACIREIVILWNRKLFVRFLEGRYPGFKGRLYASFECSPEEPLFSRDLVFANLANTLKILRNLPVFEIISDSLRKVIRTFYSSLIVVVFLVSLFPTVSTPTLTRFFAERDILSPQFFIYPGDGYVEKDYDFTVILSGMRGRISDPRIRVRQEEIRFEGGEGSDYHATVEDVKESFTYSVEFSDTTSREYTVEVVEHPRIATLTFTLSYPSYTKEGDYQTNDFDLYAIKGTEITMNAESTQPLRKAKIVFEGTDTTDAHIEGRTITCNFTVDSSTTFSVDLVSERGLRNMEKTLFNVFCYHDEFPTIELVQPGDDIDLPQDLSLDLAVRVSDDYGISRLFLVWDIEGEKKRILLPVDQKKKSSISEFHWDLMGLPMFPGDTLSYYAEVFDNDVVSGPKAKRTKTYTIRFPTAEEIFREVASEGEKVQESFQTETGKLEEVKKGLKDLEKSLRESKELTWEEKKKAEEILNREKELIENIEKTKEEMEKLAEKISDAFLSNPEIKEKLREIERLMRELETEKIREKLEDLKEALQRMDRKEMLKAMEEMILSQEEIKKSLERTVEILKRIEQEERFERIAEKAEELREEQERINQELESSSSEDLSELQDAEKDLEQELAQLQKEMGELAEELGQSDAMASETLEDATKMASEILSDIKKAQNSMKKGEKNQSLSLGTSAENKLSKMSQNLSAGFSNMLSQRKKEIAKRLDKIISDVVFLSKETEELLKSMKEVDDYETVMTREDGIKEGINTVLEEIEDMKSHHPFLSQIAEEELVLATKSIEASIQSLLKNNSSLATHHGRKVMKSLNLAALELIESKQNLPSGGSGSMAQLLQQLQSLSSGQMQVNQGTQAIIPFDISEGSMPQEIEQEMKRLSDLQSSLAERLKQVEEGLNQEGGEVLGDLGKIVEEMEEVAKELGNYSLERELVERQERILSRMLDAQRSVHKREMSKKREAERPDRVTVKDPPPLPQDLGKREGIRKDILKELEEKYPYEYRDLIRAYFERLLEEEKGKTQ
jgi:hypothetical protein